MHSAIQIEILCVRDKARDGHRWCYLGQRCRNVRIPGKPCPETAQVVAATEQITQHCRASLVHPIGQP